MGSFLSKDTNKQQEVSIEKTTPTKPILTPNYQILEVDPRSPSTNISRTPINSSSTPTKDEFCGHDTFHLNSPGVINKVLLDPRSPAVEFIRTPIVAQEKKTTTNIRNKNFDNVLLNETPKQRKPKLLGSTPVNSASRNASKRKSFAGYLETNLDFVETNLDEVLLRKSLSNLCTKSDYTPIESMINRIDKHNNICNDDDNLSLKNVNTENIVQIQNIMDDIIDDVFKIEDIKIGIIPRIVAISPKPRKIVQNFDKKIKDLIYQDSQLISANIDNNHVVNHEEIISEDAQVKLEINNDIEKDIPNDFSKKTKINNDLVKDCDKAVSQDATFKNEMIKTDAKINAQSKETKREKRILTDVGSTKNRGRMVLKDTENTNMIKRIPLTDRNGSNKTRTIPKLRVHDKPRKAQYTVSKIPQFKGKQFPKVSQTQCENTPPRKNASVWDTEDTLII